MKRKVSNGVQVLAVYVTPYSDVDQSLLRGIASTMSETDDTLKFEMKVRNGRIVEITDVDEFDLTNSLYPNIDDFVQSWFNSRR